MKPFYFHENPPKLQKSTKHKQSKKIKITDINEKHRTN